MSRAQKIVNRLLEAGLKDYARNVPDPDFITVRGSYGSIKVAYNTGRVISYDPEGDDPEYNDIVRFNIDELKQWLEANAPEDEIGPGSHVDIVDIGFWTNEGYYEEPEEEHRGITWLGQEP